MNDYKIVEGMAVVHDDGETGEVIGITPDYGEALVDFGRGKRRPVALENIDVDWEFYRDGESVHK